MRQKTLRRNYRPAALACHSFGWTCSLADRMAAKDDGSKLGLITPAGDMGRVFFPDVIVLRPVAGWTKEFTEWAHENGQYVLADLDDDLWSHEDLLDDQLPESDNYDDWFSSAVTIIPPCLNVNQSPVECWVIGSGCPAGRMLMLRCTMSLSTLYSMS